MKSQRYKERGATGSKAIQSRSRSKHPPTSSSVSKGMPLATPAPLKVKKGKLTFSAAHCDAPLLCLISCNSHNSLRGAAFTSLTGNQHLVILINLPIVPVFWWQSLYLHPSNLTPQPLPLAALGIWSGEGVGFHGRWRKDRGQRRRWARRSW